MIERLSIVWGLSVKVCLSDFPEAISSLMLMSLMMLGLSWEIALAPVSLKARGILSCWESAWGLKKRCRKNRPRILNFDEILIKYIMVKDDYYLWIGRTTRSYSPKNKDSVIAPFLGTEKRWPISQVFVAWMMVSLLTVPFCCCSTLKHPLKHHELIKNK
jgi:hypothetical protein